MVAAQVAWPGRVSWEPATSWSRHHSGGTQGLLHIEALWSGPRGLWEVGREVCRKGQRKRESLPRVAVFRGRREEVQGEKCLRLCPRPSPKPVFGAQTQAKAAQIVGRYVGRWWGQAGPDGSPVLPLTCWVTSGKPRPSLCLSFLLYKIGEKEHNSSYLTGQQGDTIISTRWYIYSIQWAGCFPALAASPTPLGTGVPADPGTEAPVRVLLTVCGPGREEPASEPKTCSSFVSAPWPPSPSGGTGEKPSPREQHLCSLRQEGPFALAALSGRARASCLALCWLLGDRLRTLFPEKKTTQKNSEDGVWGHLERQRKGRPSCLQRLLSTLL